MAFDIRVPSSGELGDEIVLTAWHKKPGDQVKPGDILAEIEAEKGTLDIEAVTEGALMDIIVPEGESVKPGSIIGRIGEPGDKKNALRAEGSENDTVQETDTIQEKTTAQENESFARRRPPRGKGHVYAAPAARKLAKDRGVDLTSIEGSGPNGTIMKRDVESVLPDKQKNRKGIVHTVTTSHRDIPQVSFSTEIEMTHALNIIHTETISFDALFISVVAKTIHRNSLFLKYWQNGTIETHQSLDVAFVLGVEELLYTPVMRKAHTYTVKEIDRMVRQAASEGKVGNLSLKDQQGGCFLVSNLGMYPVYSFQAMVHPGQSGVLAIGAVVEKPKADKGGIFVKPSVDISLSVDHRIINGVQAGQFLQDIKKSLEEYQ